MKKLIFLFILSLCVLGVSAQPTSFGGITPGKTTREELKSLVMPKGGHSVGGSDREEVLLKQPEGEVAVVQFKNNVVFRVSTTLTPGLKEALYEKYGRPQTITGNLRTVNCRNKLGASFERFQGFENSLWPVKDGVQGKITRIAAFDCAETLYTFYALTDVATETALKEKQAEEATRNAEKQRSKYEDAL